MDQRDFGVAYEAVDDSGGDVYSTVRRNRSALVNWPKLATMPVEEAPAARTAPNTVR